MILKVTKDAKTKRRDLREKLKESAILQFPGAWSPLIAMLSEEQGFSGSYLSGAVLSASLGLPDIGLTNASEVAQKSLEIARATNLPLIADFDTGFGEAMHTARSVRMAEESGLSALHIEDQVTAKRCGHLDHKTLISSGAMQGKIRAACDARLDPDFMIIARTDARGPEGLDLAIDRAKAYVDAGADMIFPEALRSPEEFAAFRRSVPGPLMANMTEFGKSPLMTVRALEEAGFDLIIWPVTLFRLALGAARKALQEIKSRGSQASLLNEMMTRKELYELLGYAEYNRFDEEIYNFDESFAGKK